MKSLEQFDLAKGQQITYCSLVCACLEALEHPHSTLLALQVHSLVQAYLNQWGFLLTAYDKLYNIYQRLMRTDDQRQDDRCLTAFDTATLDVEDDVRIHAYVMVISMKSILDFFVCLIEATLTSTIPDDNKLTDLYKFKTKWITDPSQPLSIIGDNGRFPIVNEIGQMRHKIVHRGYSIRTQFNFNKGSDLPILVYQGNNFYDENGQVAVGDLFERFLECINTWESEIARALPALQPILHRQPVLKVCFTLDGGATLFEIKEL